MLMKVQTCRSLARGRKLGTSLETTLDPKRKLAANNMISYLLQRQITTAKRDSSARNACVAGPFVLPGAEAARTCRAPRDHRHSLGVPHQVDEHAFQACCCCVLSWACAARPRGGCRFASSSLPSFSRVVPRGRRVLLKIFHPQFSDYETFVLSNVYLLLVMTTCLVDQLAGNLTVVFQPACFELVRSIVSAEWELQRFVIALAPLKPTFHDRRVPFRGLQTTHRLISGPSHSWCEAAVAVARRFFL